MRIYVKDGQKVIDFEGTLIFTRNEACIRVETECVEDPPVTFANVHIIGNHKKNWFGRIKDCITLYKFMSAKQPQ